jgi:uncharacterized protein (DUF849 family)
VLRQVIDAGCACVHVWTRARATYRSLAAQTVTRDNINPIERAEGVMAVMTSTLHGLASPMAGEEEMSRCVGGAAR